MKRGRPEPRAYIQQAGYPDLRSTEKRFGLGRGSLLRTPQELKRIVFFPLWLPLQLLVLGPFTTSKPASVCSSVLSDKLAYSHIAWLFLGLSGVNYQVRCGHLIACATQLTPPRVRIRGVPRSGCPLFRCRYLSDGGSISFRKVYRAWNSYGCKQAGCQDKWW